MEWRKLNLEGHLMPINALDEQEKLHPNNIGAQIHGLERKDIETNAPDILKMTHYRRRKDMRWQMIRVFHSALSQDAAIQGLRDLRKIKLNRVLKAFSLS